MLHSRRQLCVRFQRLDPAPREVAGDTKRWEVVIENGCPCTVLDLELGCAGFRPLVPIDPPVVSQEGARCLVDNGQPIYPSSSFNFTYAADSSYDFTIADFTPACY
ncbi:hypothetical protein MLD38_022569 [Melastoma candidum]|uniref:Uncharacterized protein n=1 Tax=Melastoma candidum TaxID=119954 RepID=A0ACB9QST9_9MYRT|nr:hypothetical protein MLD38_022569 [Melastoma candidum]